MTDPGDENRLISINTASDRTLFFDLLPLEMGRVLGHTLKIQLYTVPGQVRYDATRRVVLSGADAVVFVADSQRGKGAENRAAWENLRANLKLNGLDPGAMPVVVQYNKQDLPGCLTPQELEGSLQSAQSGIGACALRGRGVMETFHSAVLVMLKRLTVLTGRRRAEDMLAIEEQVRRAFERYFSPPPSAASAASVSAAASAAAEGTSGPAAAPAPAPDAPASPAIREPGLVRAAGAAPEPREAGSRGEAPIAPPTSLRITEEGNSDALRVRSLRATLGIAEQYGEMRDLKTRLARRVSELEGLQALSRDLTSRHDRDAILAG